MKSFQYFAYGSNMLTERIRARCSSATARCVAASEGYRLAFSKRSDDGSGKATICRCADGACRVYGVVFEVGEGDLERLDEGEGKGAGYDRVDDFRVHLEGVDDVFGVVTYIASREHTDDRLRPYDWYLRLVLAGARQHALPPGYVAAIEAVSSIKDPCIDRPTRRKALELLEKIPS